MKSGKGKQSSDDIRPEYNLGTLGEGTCGKHLKAYRVGTNLALLVPEVRSVLAGDGMCPSYVRIRLSFDEALARFTQGIRLPELAPPAKVKASEATKKACKNGVWRSIVAVYVYESADWTVFDDLTGHLASFPADRWREFAGREELVFAGYNDAVPYGQLIVIQSGRVVRNFLDDRQDSQGNVNHGRLPFEKESPINDWIGVASFVDEDEMLLYPDEGLLWMFGTAKKGNR